VPMRSSANPERFEDGRPMLLAGLRRRHSFAEVEAGVVEQWREFLLREAVPNRVGTWFYGVMCGSDGVGLEYMCAVQVESFDTLAADVGRMRVPVQRYAVFSHPDGATLGSTWPLILAWLADGPYESSHRPDFEIYPSAPDPMLPWGVEVWVGVVERVRRETAGPDKQSQPDGEEAKWH
jgi:AraC family transcriptional regulator